MNKQLDEANKLKARFFAILSHDLRAPVTNLMAFLRLQNEEPGIMSAEQTLTGKQKINQATEALLGNMEAMLLWSKGQMENFKPVMKAVHVKDLFTYISNLFASAGNVEFFFVDPRNIELYTDEDYVRTIMQNLTANAIKALNSMPDSRIKWQVINREQTVRLSISDNGPGMKQRELNAFYSNEPMANKKYGFGLYMVRELARAIHCNIECDSGTSKGTTFTLVFNNPST